MTGRGLIGDLAFVLLVLGIVFYFTISTGLGYLCIVIGALFALVAVFRRP